MTRVLLDVDGVLANFVSAYLVLVRDVTGRDYKPADVTQFDIGASLGLSAGESSECKRRIADTPGLARCLNVYPGAVEGVSRLQSIADVYIVTSPWNSHPTWTHDREHWLKKHFDIPHSRVIHTSAKHVCRGDVFVDDKVSAVAKWRDAHPDGLPVVWSTPHNRRDLWDGQCTSDWNFLCELVEMQGAL
jgi:5'(3')-deoxyribonucleotidase